MQTLNGRSRHKKTPGLRANPDVFAALTHLVQRDLPEDYRLEN